LKDFDFDFLEDEKREINFRLLFFVFLILGVSIYIGYLIYGNRGLSRLIEIKSNREILEKRIKKLRTENVKLQKEYFSLKDIEDDK